MSLADLRREYTFTSLRRSDLAPDPIAQFRKWFDEATGARASGRLRQRLISLYKSLLMVTGAEPMDLNAMTLATADRQGRPSARTVLLKGLDERGFIFFSNYQSRKGRELAENPLAALVFYWAGQERQVTVAGSVAKLPIAESEAYFNSRPRGSRIAAWASQQTCVVPDRGALEKAWTQSETQFSGAQIPIPPFWGGYVLSPHRLEFWQGRANRLHDRFRYTRAEGDQWIIERLCP
jgi:pyridoxamine 5'-phosphate oxidase